MYSVGKIPGGFYKREGKPSERAVLTTAYRPTEPTALPGGYAPRRTGGDDAALGDQDTPPDIVAMNAASAAITLSDIPYNGPPARCASA